MRQKLMDFMRGRNGTDQLSMCMMWAACILVFIDMFVRNNILSTIAFVNFAFAYFRVFSRNIGKRRDENTWLLNKTYKLRMWGRKEKSHMTMRKTHHIYRCPECKQKIRIPKGKGKIEIRCPKCSARFIKNS